MKILQTSQKGSGPVEFFRGVGMVNSIATIIK